MVHEDCLKRENEKGNNVIYSQEMWNALIKMWLLQSESAKPA